MSITKDDLKILEAPFDAATLGVKVQSTSKDKTKAMLVCYIQHTDTYARIEKVDPAWSSQILSCRNIGTDAQPWFATQMRVTIKGVSRENEGEGETPKNAASDALKRTAMLFGVGRYLYDSETVWVPYNEQNDRYRAFTYEDYKKGLRSGQAGPALASAPNAAASKTITPPGGSAAASGQPAAPISMSRMELGSAIVKLARQLKCNDAELAEWVLSFHAKPMSKLSIPEMNAFYEMLQAEPGAKGA